MYLSKKNYNFPIFSDFIQLRKMKVKKLTTTVVWCTLTKLLYCKTSNCATTRIRFTLLWPTFWSPSILMMISGICMITEPSKLTWENLWVPCLLMFLPSLTKLLGIWKFWRRPNQSLSQVRNFFWRENSNTKFKSFGLGGFDMKIQFFVILRNLKLKFLAREFKLYFAVFYVRFLARKFKFKLFQEIRISNLNFWRENSNYY